MELRAWVAENMTMLVCVPLLLLALIVPLLLTIRGQRESTRKKSTSCDSSYVPIVPDSSGSVDSH